MTFPFNVYLYAFIGAWVVSLLALPIWRSVCRRVGLVDDPGHRKIHESPIPLAGGFSVLTAMIIPLALGAAFLHWNLPNLKQAHGLLEHGLSRRGIELAAIFLGAFVIVLTGALDDKFELRPAMKFGGQFLAAALITLANVRITLFVHSFFFSYAITVLWILTVTNAFNFMDNMNGLCTGLGAISVWFFSLIAAVSGQYLVGLIGFVAFGALLGFLPYNFPKASAFLGDTGSHLVGYLLAVMAVLPHFYTPIYPHPWAVFVPLLVLAVPLGDMAWVVIYRLRIGQPIYQGDNNHLSHRLVKAGFTKQKAVLCIWLLGTVACAIGLALMLGPG